jgi:PAS domain S-box-containing protein
MNKSSQKLLEYIKIDASLFDFIQQWDTDGLLFRDVINPQNNWINPKLCRSLGYDHEKITNIESILTASNLSLVTNQKNVVLIDEGGSKHAMKCKHKLIKDSQGKTIAYLSCFRKSKSNVNSHKKLKKQGEFLENSNEAAQIGYWEVNLKNKKIFWSRITKLIHEVPLDYDPNLDGAINFFNDGQHRDSISYHFTLCATEGKPYELELQITTLQGNVKWVKAIGQATFYKGKYKRVYGTFQDITKVKNANIALHQEKEKLQSIIQSTNSGTWEWNIQTDETKHNEIWANIIGYTLAEIAPITTQKWQNLIHPDDIEQSDLKLQDCFNQKVDYYEAEYRIKHKNGQWIWVLDKGKIISRTLDNEPLLMFGIHTDITEQKKSVLRNILFIEQAPTAIAMLDTNMRYLAASKKWLEDYKLTNKVIIGVSHYDLFPRTSDEWKQHHQNCLKGIPNKREEECFFKKDGSVQWISWELRPWYNDNGTVGGVIMYTANITNRKKTEDQLKVSEAAFRANFENAAIGMAFIDKNGKWLKVNTRLCEILGYTNEELLQKNFVEITHADDIKLDLSLLKEIIQGKRSYYHIEKRYFAKDGSIVYIILGVSVVRNENNEILYFITQTIDVSAQKTAEKQLEENNSKMKALLEASTQVALIETDKNGLIQTFNKGAENLLGYSKEEMINKQTPALIHLESEIKRREKEILDDYNFDVKGFEVFTFAANKGEYDTREWTYVKKDGSHFPVQLTVTAVTQNNSITGYLGIATDISYIKKTEKEIQSLLVVTKDQNERLKNFAHIVSHNLRSHSGNISMMLDLYLQEYPELQENEFMELLNSASNNLKETIDHLNEVVVMNTATSQNLLSINLYDYMEKTIKNVAALAINATVKIDNTINSSVNIKVIPAYLESILLNFVTNGIKYKSNERKSFIKIYSTIENGYVVVHIEDNGIGIDLKKNRDKLFGMYKTFHNNEDARGIGLFISKNQIEAMNGKIEVESEVNVGTTFKIYFKYEKN